MVVGLFDEQLERIGILKNWLTSYSVRKGLEFGILTFKEKNASTAFEKYASSINVAFVSLEGEFGTLIGQKMTILNPCCIICFYAQQPREMGAMKYTRPFEFFIWPQHELILDRIMDTMLKVILQSGSVYTHSSRRETYYYPIRNLLFFQSDLKYVNVFTEIDSFPEIKIQDTTPSRLYAKLLDIENELIKQNIYWTFVRLHKSFIANMLHITQLSSANHTAYLSSGESLPISDAYYKKAVERIKAFHSNREESPINTGLKLNSTGKHI